MRRSTIAIFSIMAAAVCGAGAVWYGNRPETIDVIPMYRKSPNETWVMVSYLAPGHWVTTVVPTQKFNKLTNYTDTIRDSGQQILVVQSGIRSVEVTSVSSAVGALALMTKQSIEKAKSGGPGYVTSMVMDRQGVAQMFSNGGAKYAEISCTAERIEFKGNKYVQAVRCDLGTPSL